MGRNPTVEKRINGRVFTQSQFRHKLIETIRKLTEGDENPSGVRAREIAMAWGDPSWEIRENLQLLAQSLVNMEKQKLLVSTMRGHYRVHEARVAMGLDRREEYETAMVKALEDNGGFAQRRHINAALGAGRVEYDDRRPEIKDSQKQRTRGDSIYSAIGQILPRSEVIRRDYHGALPNLYNLAPERLAALPLMGRWARLQIMYGFSRVGGDPIRTVLQDDIPNKAVADFFRSVGRAFKQVMDITGSDLVQAMAESKDLRWAVRDFADNHPTRSKLLEDLRKSYDAPKGDRYVEMRGGGKTYDDINLAREAAEKDFEASFLYKSYDLFCEGDVETHVYAPLDFYRAYAEWANADPAALSRGLLFWSTEKTQAIRDMEADEGVDDTDEEDDPPEN